MSSITMERPVPKGSARAGRIRRLWDRQLPHYPETAARTTYLGITVLATIVLYYQLYVQGAVSTDVLHAFGFSFPQFVLVLVVGNAFGAFASLFAGLADRWGRANLLVGGLLAIGLIVGIALPNAGSKAEYIAFFSLLSIVEGMALVATPALIRDFSPQVGRGTAMGLWTMGPVLGSLIVTTVSSYTLAGHPWQFQFQIAGAIGIAVALIALVGLRELSPGLRDQIMHSVRDRALIEARAEGIDPEAQLHGHWRQMLKLDIVGPCIAIAVFLLLYYVFVAFLVVFFSTVFHYSAARANSLAHWYWVANAVALLAGGVISDRFRVRKPFMLVGAVVSLIGVALFASATTNPHTSYGTFALYFVLIAVGGGLANVAWMAAFTETVEKRNPAATATGLAIFGWILRITVVVSFLVLPKVIPATNTLVEKAPRLQSIVRTYPEQVKVLKTVGPELAALKSNPNNKVAQARALSALSGRPVADVAKVVTLGAQYKPEFVTAATIDPATRLALATDRTDLVAAKNAVGEISQNLGVTPAEATARLQALGHTPEADLAFLKANAPAVKQAAAEIKSISAVPHADLAYLAANGPKVAQAAKENPGQWQTWWWICWIAQLLYIPFVFVIGGRWSPRKAREDEAAHEQRVQRELNRLVRRPAPASAR